MWNEGSLCRVIPVSACSTPRCVSARCADVVPFKVWRASRSYESSLCRVVPFKDCSTPRGAKARCAECGSVSVVQPSAVARAASRLAAHAFTLLFISLPYRKSGLDGRLVKCADEGDWQL